MHKLFLCTLVCALMFVSCSEKIAQPVSQVKTIEQKFPDSWIGTWVGELGIYRGTKRVQSIPMEMVIAQSDSVGHYIWQTTFSGKESVEKPYELITKDVEKGFYLLDEHNSIKIETFLFDNKMVSWYEVGGTIIMASHELRGEQLVFEILAGPHKYASTTGDTKVGEEDIPAVNTWPISVLQRGVLSRKK